MSGDCGRVDELLGRFIDGELDEQQSAWVGRHLDACPECRYKLAELETVDRLFQEKDEPPRLAEEYWDWHRNQVWRAIRAERPHRWQGARTLRFNWMRTASVVAGAAVVLIAAIGGWRLLQRHGAAPLTVSEERGGSEPGEAFVAETAAGGRRAAAPGERAAETKSAEVPRPSTQPGEATAVLDRMNEAESETVADGGGATAGAFADELEPFAGEQPEVVGLAKVRGQDDADGSQESATRRMPASPELAEAGAAAEQDSTARAQDTVACDVEPELVSIGLLPRVSTGDTATVLLRALVEKDGSVSRVEFEQPSGYGLLDSIAVRNVRQARFRAGLQGDETVRCWVRVAQQFEAELPADSGQDNQ